MHDSPYPSLDQHSQEIRVLEIAPGAYDDDLVITLRLKKLNKKRPRYNALSYVWGSNVCPRQASLNGRLVTIGQNLDDALRCLRKTMSGHLLWVDALCINQSDVDERSQQVQLMGDVFSSANEVIIWLGEARPDDHYAINMIKRDRIPAANDKATRLINALTHICSRPWFGRVWVAQELSLAQRSPLIQLGYCNIRWTEFYDYLRLVKEESLTRVAAKEWPDRPCWALRKALFRVDRLDEIRAFRPVTITVQLEAAARLQATDPRDLVYGLLGICHTSPSQIPIVADYSKSVRQVFLETSCSMLQDTVLPYRWFPLYPPPDEPLQPTLAPLGLPSWAFDISITPRTPSTSRERNLPIGFLPLSLNNSDFDAGISHLPPCSRFSVDLERLHAVGLHIGTISATSSDLFYTSHPKNRKSRLLAPEIVYDFYNKVLLPRRISPTSFCTVFSFRDVNVDLDVFQHLLSERYDTNKLFDNMTDFPTEHLWEQMWETLLDLTVKMDMVVFVTDEGHLGSLYHPDPLVAVQPGDVLVGLFGRNFPFVLRPLPRETDGEQLYSMVNLAYVVDHEYGHDFITDSGEEMTWKDFERFGLREYSIV